MSSPKCCLIAAPGCGDSDYGEHHGLKDLQYFVAQRLRGFFVLAEVVSDFYVGTSSFGHWEDLLLANAFQPTESRFKLQHYTALTNASAVCSPFPWSVSVIEIFQQLR